MTQVELALISYWLKTHKVVVVGDTRKLKDCHYISGVGPKVKG